MIWSMPKQNMENIGKTIITSNNFMSIATSFTRDTWIAPVFYCTDENYNFYFVSSVDSKHVIHIVANPNVAISIFDSKQ